MSLRLVQDGALLRVILDRPEASNAFDDRLIAELTAAFRKAADDDGIDAVMLQANGKYFSAGGDLAWMQRMARYTEAENVADARALAGLMQAIDLCPKPTLARVQGSAFAGAVGLLACCDLVASVRSAQFAITEVRIGLIPAVISPYVTRAIGMRQMRRYALTGERFSAEAALAMGLVHQIAEDENALDGLLQEWLGALSQGSAKAQAATKELLASIANRPIDAAVSEETARRIARQRASDEGREGVASFLEKRAPSWRRSKA